MNAAPSPSPVFQALSFSAFFLHFVIFWPLQLSSRFLLLMQLKRYLSIHFRPILYIVSQITFLACLSISTALEMGPTYFSV